MLLVHFSTGIITLVDYAVLVFLAEKVTKTDLGWGEKKVQPKNDVTHQKFIFL